jgi:RNA polymerase sigma factor (TIGR02999 family)
VAKNHPDDLFQEAYAELHRLAERFLHNDRRGHTLQPTALVHEAYLKMLADDSLKDRERTHFLAIAARLMRQILVDHARKRHAEKRGGQRLRVTLHDAAVAIAQKRDVDVLALEDALNDLSDMDKRKVQVVELRFYGGLTEQEVAEVLEVSLGTVERDWHIARAWLRKQMGKG